MYQVKVKEGFIHEVDLVPGTVLEVDESAFNAFRDKFELVGDAPPPPPVEEGLVHEEMPASVKIVLEALEVEGTSNLSDEEILAVNGIGPARLEEIREWQHSMPA